jgi:hypothetical protein
VSVEVAVGLIQTTSITFTIEKRKSRVAPYELTRLKIMVCVLMGITGSERSQEQRK